MLNYFLCVIFAPFIGFCINLLFFKNEPKRGSQISVFFIWLGLAGTLYAWIMGLPFLEKNESFGFSANEISWIAATLILFVSANVHRFSLRYMEGDRLYRPYFLRLNLITLCALLMGAADNVILFLAFWLISNVLLTRLMTHNVRWVAAKNSGKLAIKTFILGFAFLSLGLAMLAFACGTFSIDEIAQSLDRLSPATRFISLGFLTLAALTQSGAFPFHSWLISSLNSPTPVSAIMHAGLVNGGGLLLIRFAPLILHDKFILNLLFITGVATLILGGIWKLLQSDIKRMLACSTMAQMGFMLMQCGLGLFSFALGHICWHGLFKAYLFLRSGSSLKESNFFPRKRRLEVLLYALPVSLSGPIGFIIGSDLVFTLNDTSLVLICFSWIASTQLASSVLLNQQNLMTLIFASIVCFAAGALYGATVNLIDVSMKISEPQPLNLLHITAMSSIFFFWVLLNIKSFEHSTLWKRFYVRMLTAGQPHPTTVTSTINEYRG